MHHESNQLLYQLVHLYSLTAVTCELIKKRSVRQYDEKIDEIDRIIT